MRRRQIIEEESFRESLPNTATPVDYSYSPTRGIANLVYTIVSVLEVMLGLRFVLLILGANPANAFVSLVYDLTRPLVWPFVGMFGRINTLSASGIHSFDTATLVAMAVYGLVGWLVIRLLLIGREPV